MAAHQDTVDTYNRAAEELAKYFKGIGPRVADIERAFKLAGGDKTPRVIEIGCGDGRDALEILRRTPNYLGFDVSEGMIKIARKNIPHGHFEITDAVSFNYPPGTDVVIAFASLLHLDAREVKTILNKVHSTLRPGGIFYISLKYAPAYRKFIQNDQYGSRLFYLYNPEKIRELAGNKYEEVFLSKELKGNTEWFEIALKKSGS